MTERNQYGERAPANRKLFVEAMVAALAAIKNQRAARDGEAAGLTRSTLLVLVDKKLAANQRRDADPHREAGE